MEATQFGPAGHGVRLAADRRRVARLVLSGLHGNAISTDLVHAFTRALDELAGRPDLALLRLEADGDDFCAGYTPAEKQRPLRDLLVPAWHAALRRLAALDVVVVVSLKGRCLGPALDLVALSHWSLAAPSARLGAPDAPNGLVPAVAALLLPTRLGQVRADELLLTGRVLEAKDASDLRLVTEFTGGWESLETATERVVADLASRPASALRLVARALRPDLPALLGARLDALETLMLE